MSLSESIARRLEYRAKIGDDPYKQALENALCANDILHWIRWWVWTYDPREDVTTIPLLQFDRQEEFILWLQECEELKAAGLVEKSRDMGITWECVTYANHGWLYRNGFKAGFGSRKLDLVDKIGDMDSILEKMRFLLRNLPYWMLPPSFKFGEHDGFTKILNPDTGAAVTGEGGDQIGRGGRASIYFVDESAFLERPQLVERSLSQTTKVRIDVSTPNGPGTPFTRKRFSGKIRVFTFHWRQDPRKDDAWYEGEKERLDAVTVAQEIDIDHTASIEGIVIPAMWVRAAVLLDLAPSGSRVAALDVAAGGKNANVLIFRDGPVVYDPATWTGKNTTQTALDARDRTEQADAQLLVYDVVGLGEGVRGTLDSLEHQPRFVIRAFNGGESPTEDVWPDKKTSKEKFINARAEYYWKLRARFEKTYEYVVDGVKHPAEEMISIPDDPTLIAQLSTPLCERTSTGKLKIESKEDMRARGVASPDHADALMMTLVSPKGVTRAALVEAALVTAHRPAQIGFVPGGLW